MSQQLLTGGDGSTGQSGLQSRNVINENFTEVYSYKSDTQTTYRTHDGNYTMAAEQITDFDNGASVIIVGDDTGDLTTLDVATGYKAGVRGYANVVAGSGDTVTGTRGDLTIPSGMTAVLEQTAANTFILHNGSVGGGGGASDAASISFTPAGTISATNVQDAIEEVAAEAGGSVSDASETEKGIVEEATAAQVAAGTATGETGAKLFITPTKLLGYRSLVSVSISPSGGNLTLALDKIEKAFYADISAAVAIILSVTSPYKSWKLVLRVTGTRVVTLPSDCYMTEAESNLGRWNGGTKELTLIGTTNTSFELTGWFENSIWMVQCAGPYV